MDKLKEILSKLGETFQKLTMMQKMIAGGVLLAIVVAIGFTFVNSSQKEVVLLFQKPLRMEDYAAITTEVEKMGIEFSTKADKYIIVKDEETAKRIRMKLAQDGKIPGGIKAWDLFDMESWTTSEFQRNVKLRRAITGNMQAHLESLDWIETAVVSVSEPKSDPNRPYTDNTQEVEASVTITPSPGFSHMLVDKKIIRGVQDIIARGIDGLDAKNISITGPNGEQLNDDLDDAVGKRFEEIHHENRIQTSEEKKISQKITTQLRSILPEKRFSVSVKLNLNFDQESNTKKELLPMILVPDDPKTAYSELKYTNAVVVSEKITGENFKGENFIPEGPPGQEPNIPPGYKERLDGLNTYNKDEKIRNYDYGVQNSDFKRSGVKEQAISVALTVDGTWEYEVDDKGQFIFEDARKMFKRKYLPYPEEELVKLERTVKAAINFNPYRGDTVAIENVMFDRFDEFIALDAKYLQDRKTQQTLFFALITLVLLFVISVAYRLIKKELIRRKRLREREEARQRQLQRDEALRALESDSPVESMSEEDKKRMDLQDRAEQLAMERPEDVAKLIRSWISED